MYSVYNKSIPTRLPAKKSENEATWEYYEPPEHWVPIQFFEDTSLHGLHYIGQRKRHLCERIFWMVAFIGAVIAAGLLIWEMWHAYTRMPIVTVFNPSETPLNEIPFPAVTICNVNNIKKSKLDEYTRNVFHMRNILNKTALNQALAAIADVQNICAADTFAMRISQNARSQNQWATWFDNFTTELMSKKQEYEKFINPTKILIDGSQKCNEMILWCIWLDEIRNCSELFQEVETDYGYCCTFNTIPLTLLMKFMNDSRDDPERLKEWDDADMTYENILFTEETKNRKYPYRQLYPGRTAGLSLLLEPNLTEYSCTNTDSEGFVIGINVPLDFPRMRDNGVLVRTSSEVFINLRPQITISEESIRKFELEKRNCYFDGERELPHYSKYTASNCIDECIAYRTFMACGCVRYYMPRSEKNPLCRPDKYACVDQVRKNLTQSGLEEGCLSCLSTCTEIEYLAEVTSLHSRKDYMDKLFKSYPQYTKTGDASIVHVYFSQDSVYPRLRKEMYTVIDLISNTGGLLGLCMGFSMLSLLEILYYCSIRLCCTYRRRSKKKAKDEDHASAPYPSLPSYYDPQPKQGWGSKFFSRSPDENKNHMGRSEDNIFTLVRNTNYPSRTNPVYYKPPY